MVRVTRSRFSELIGISAFAGVFLLLGPAPATAEPITVFMKQSPNRFDKKIQEVKVGDELVWKNEGGSHTATPDPNQPDPFPNTKNVPVGQTSTVWKVTGAPRTIKYHCEVHGSDMTGEIVVVGAR